MKRSKTPEAKSPLGQAAIVRLMWHSPILEPMKNEKTENAGSQVHHKYKLQFPGETGTTILAIMQSSYHVPKKFELP